MRNKFFKNIVALALVAVTVLACDQVSTRAYASAPIEVTTESSNEVMLLRSDYTGWRFMWVGDLLYTRLFNYSKDEWIGEWILVE